jgi:hypothetical protein
VPEVVPNSPGLPTALNQLVATFPDTVVPALVIRGIGTRLAVLLTIGVTAVYFLALLQNIIAQPQRQVRPVGIGGALAQLRL